MIKLIFFQDLEINFENTKHELQVGFSPYYVMKEIKIVVMVDQTIIKGW